MQRISSSKKVIANSVCRLRLSGFVRFGELLDSDFFCFSSFNSVLQVRRKFDPKSSFRRVKTLLLHTHRPPTDHPTTPVWRLGNRVYHKLVESGLQGIQVNKTWACEKVLWKKYLKSSDCKFVYILRIQFFPISILLAMLMSLGARKSVNFFFWRCFYFFIRNSPVPLRRILHFQEPLVQDSILPVIVLVKSYQSMRISTNIFLIANPFVKGNFLRSLFVFACLSGLQEESSIPVYSIIPIWNFGIYNGIHKPNDLLVPFAWGITSKPTKISQPFSICDMLELNQSQVQLRDITKLY